ncbi:MAG: hypothetical protein HY661_10695 [Betaproteobacteria bacterium]|nr:hypothetical protein [Betaproteobacteria bacterium]
MRSPAATTRPTRAEEAASRVLEAERAALAQVEQCKLQALQLVAEGRAHAELVRKRAEARIERLRERMTVAARLRQERIRSEMAALERDMGTDASVFAALDRAITRIIEELAGTSESS